MRQYDHILTIVAAALFAVLTLGVTNPRLFAEQQTETPSVADQASDDRDFTLAQDAAEEYNDEPLILAAPEENGSDVAEEVEALPEAIVTKKDDATEEAIVDVQTDELEFDEEEMRRLSNEPLFKEFSEAIDDVAPLPQDLDLSGIGADGDYFATPSDPEPQEIVSSPFNAEAASRALDEVLAIADVDLSSIPLAPEERETLDRLNAEIDRLSKRWIDAELNMTTIGRRELDWRSPELARYSTSDPIPIDAPANDWALAPDAPFFFKVVDTATNQEFYTKAGDFEPLDASGTIGLTRGDRTFFLAIEPSVALPSGRAERTRVLKNGKIQGVKFNEKIVTDFNLGKIQLFAFDVPSRLASDDGVLFVPTQLSGAPKLLDVPDHIKVGVSQRKLLLSNGRPDEIFARLVVLCKSKKRLIEILTQP